MTPHTHSRSIGSTESPPRPGDSSSPSPPRGSFSLSRRVTSRDHGILTRIVALAGAVILLGAAAPACGSTDASAAGPATDSLRQKAVSVQVGHTLGRPDAPIAVVEFSDFGCPYCARFARTTLPQIRDELIDEGIVRWRYVPVTFGFPGGELMGAAAECAAQQGGPDTFWEVHDLFYARQVALRSPDARPRLLDWLAELGLDRNALDRCIDDPTTKQLLESHNAASRQWLVRGTPTFIVNGVPMSGALPMEFFEQVFATMLDPSGL